MIRRLAVLMGAVALHVSAAPSAAWADEGMWTFDNFPAQAVKEKYGVDLSRAWLDRVRGSGVRLSTGCSASVVSGQGLVLTNHHCVSDCVQVLSSPADDRLKDGFIAGSRQEELRCEGMQAEILMEIADVSEQVSRAGEGKSGEAYVRSRDAEIAGLEKARCAGREATHRCQVLTLYQGGEYKLHTFRRFADVRLVLAPEFKMAFFGGDPDNFNFPRYDLDFAFLRLYEGGRPVATPVHLTWSSQAPKAGEPVFVVGNPGSTSRLLTADQLQSLRDFVLPTQQLQRSELRGRLIQLSAEGPEQARLASHDLFSLENSFKATFGQVKALSDPAFIAGVRDRDEALKRKAAAMPGIGDPWGEIARVQADYAALFAGVDLIERRAGSLSQLFMYGRALVRGAAERGKPNGERLPEFSDARLPGLEQSLFERRPVHPQMEALYLEFWLLKVREHLTVDAPETQVVLGRQSPEGLARRLSQSALGDPAVRRRLWEGGAEAIATSDDPMIRFIVGIDPTARALRADFERRVSGPVGQASERIARARFLAYGASTYPDATFSPRISYGAIEGWTYQGRTVEPATRLSGLFDRATGEPPYDLPQRWLDLKPRLDLNTVFNLASTNDIIGGNSGSPLINARAEVVGAVFDGNIHSLGGAYSFDPALNRAVSVSTEAITEALDKVYGQSALLAELRGR